MTTHSKILKEIVRYIRVVVPRRGKDLWDALLPGDKIKVGNFTVELNPIAHGKLDYPGVDITFFQISKKTSPGYIPVSMVNVAGWVSIIMDLNYRRIIHVECSNNYATHYIYKHKREIVDVCPTKYEYCGERVRTVLSINDIIYENGGRKEDILNLYNQLILLNMKLV